MLKHYCKWQFKQWWPLLLIFSLVLTLTISISVTSAQITRILYQTEGGYQSYGTASSSSVIPTLFYSALVPTLVMPLFVFSYRTRRQSADTYYQAAYAPTTIQKVRMIIGLIIVLGSLLVAFTFGTTIFLLRYFLTPLQAETTNYIVCRVDMNWGWYFLAFLVAFISVGAEYLINCFLVSLGNYTFDQICLLIFGNIFFCLLFAAPVLYAYVTFNMDLSILNGAVYAIGPLGPASLISAVFSAYQMGSTVDGAISAHASMSTLVHVAAAVGCLFYNLKVPDPSGEFADRSGPRNKGVALFPHGAAAVIGFLVSCLGFIFVSVTLAVLPVFLFSLYAVGYYAILALWRHGFRQSKFDLLCYICVVGVTLALLCINMVAVHR